MCLSVPAKIVELEGRLATVDVLGNRREADVSLVDEPRLGDYVLVHAGFAIQKMTAEDAAETLRLWEEIARIESYEPSTSLGPGPRAASREPAEEDGR